MSTSTALLRSPVAFRAYKRPAPNRETYVEPESPSTAPSQALSETWLHKLGSFTARRHRAVLVGAAVLFVLATVVGMGAFKQLKSGGQADPQSSSSQAARWWPPTSAASKAWLWW